MSTGLELVQVRSASFRSFRALSWQLLPCPSHRSMPLAVVFQVSFDPPARATTGEWTRSCQSVAVPKDQPAVPQRSALEHTSRKAGLGAIRRGFKFTVAPVLNSNLSMTRSRIIN